MRIPIYCFLLLAFVAKLSHAQNVLNDLNQTLVGRSFTVDWNRNTFLKDGKPFRFIAGSFHYFRAHPETWQRKLRTMRAAGLNAVTTYVEWSLHNPKENIYVWEGIANLEKFIKLAIIEDLFVILRPGPYICAERDMGGFPYWLLTKYPGIQLRTADINYLYEVRLWYAQLMPRITPFLYGNGGPIILVQVENEYGSYFACDQKYRTWLRDETSAHIKDKAVLFTNDGVSVLSCGHIPGVLATLDFGPTNDLSERWNMLRKIQPNGPLVNSEYYPGWLTHWNEPIARVAVDPVAATLVNMLDDGASVNFYMFYGGTNFGFTAGSNDLGPGKFQPDITSYDYDAPMDESGDPTEKYAVLRDIIGRYVKLPNIPVPTPLPKKAYGFVRLAEVCSILSPNGRKYVATGTVNAIKPVTFEALNQYSGFVLYETNLPNKRNDPSILKVSGIHDRGYVYIDETLVGILSREHLSFLIPISASSDKRLQILVENQGRINYGNSINDFKGIIGDILLDKKIINNWNMTKYPLESYEDLLKLIQETEMPIVQSNETAGAKVPLLNAGPTLYQGVLTIVGDLHDTYIDTSGWGKGIIFVNGENIGRYWPTVGPQVTLYVPREVLKVGENKILLLEYQRTSVNSQLIFTNIPNFNGYQRK